jgi:DNA repair photolyase
MGTNTDPYQKAEGKYHLTKGIVGVLAEARNPFSILTKSTLVLRDLALLAEATRRTRVRLDVSIGTLERDVWRLTEPGTPPPEKRLDTVRRLNEAGVPCGVLVAPVLPGLSDADEQLREVAEACVAAGAVSVTPIALHLRRGVREHYLGWLGKVRPELVALYAERFASGAYQPKAEQRRIAQAVGAVAWRSGSRPGVGEAPEAPESPEARLPREDNPTESPADEHHPSRIRPVPVRPSGEQLRLL